MNYKVGDTVRIKSKQWYVLNKNRFGENFLMSLGVWFVHDMSLYCGKKCKIDHISDSGQYQYYRLDIDFGHWNWTDDMFDDAELLRKNRKEKIKKLNF